jgi:hypothetical protein
MGGSSSKIVYNDNVDCKSIKNVRQDPLSFNNLDYVRCVFLTQDQYNNNYHIPKSSLTVTFDSTMNNIENDIDNNIYNVYAKLNEVTKSPIPIKVLSPIFVAFSRKLEYVDSIFDDDNMVKYPVELKKNDGYCLAIKNYMESFFKSNDDINLKNKYYSLPHSKYDFKGNVKVIIFFPFLTNQYKYITNFRDIINSSYYFLSLISKIEFNGLTEVNSFDEDQIREANKNAPKNTVDAYIQILKKQDNMRLTYRKDLLALCNSGGCLSESGGEDFKSLLPQLSNNDGDNINNAIKFSPFLPSKCLSQTVRYKCGVEEVINNNKTPQELAKTEKIMSFLSSSLSSYLLNEYCYTQKNSPNFDSDKCRGKPDDNANMQQTPVDVINNILNIFLKKQYKTDINDDDDKESSAYYSQDYSINIIKELMLINNLYPGIQEVVFPLYKYNKNSDYITVPPWGDKLLTPDRVINENEGVAVNQKKYSFNDNYYLTLNEKGQLIVCNSNGSIYYYLSIKEIPSPMNVTLSSTFTVTYIAPKSGYVRTTDVLSGSSIKIIDKSDNRKEPYIFYLNDDGRLRIFANGFIDATDKSFIDYIENKIVENQNGLSSDPNNYDKNNKFIGNYNSIYDKPVYIANISK